MRVVFMGTPSFAVPSLRALVEAHEVTLVVTRPDAIRGRGKRLEPSPVKIAAVKLGIPVLEAKRLGHEETARIVGCEPDIICVAAYGAILSDEVLDIAPQGTVNVHASLLPRGRGAAPIQRAVLEGDKLVGVSIMRIVKELDAGPYCRQASIEVGDTPCAEVMASLAVLGATELVAALNQIEDGTVSWTEQDASLVTYAAKVEKREMLLDPKDSALDNRRRVQASLDTAPARAVVGGKGVRVMDACMGDKRVGQGDVLVERARVFLGCADASLEVLRVKPDGRREMEAAAWASGLRGKDIAWARV